MSPTMWAVPAMEPSQGLFLLSGNVAQPRRRARQIWSLVLAYASYGRVRLDARNLAIFYWLAACSLASLATYIFVGLY